MNPFSGPVLHSFVYIIVFLAAWTINYGGSKSVAIVLSMTLTQNTEKKGQFGKCWLIKKMCISCETSVWVGQSLTKKTTHSHSLVWLRLRYTQFDGRIFTFSRMRTNDGIVRDSGTSRLTYLYVCTAMMVMTITFYVGVDVECVLLWYRHSTLIYHHPQP